MSIFINNSLPSIYLHIGIIEDDDNLIRVSVATAGAIDIDNKTCY